MALDEKQKKLLEATAKSNSIERVSLWLYAEDKSYIKSEFIFSLSKNEFLPGLTFLKNDYPNYFSALEKNRIIDANDADTDERTKEFADSYLKSIGITSLLDVPIIIDGKVIGVICHEHVGKKRIWSKEEQLFSTSIADQFAVLIESQNKTKILYSLIEKEKQLSTILNTVADVIFVLKVEDNNRFQFESVNNSFSTTTGIPMEAIVGSYVNDIIPEPSLQIVLDRYKKSISKKEPVTWEETTDYPTGKLTGIVTVSPVFDNDGICTQLIGSVKDITERKKIETELQRNEERFRLLAETTKIIPWETDAKTFQFTYVGPQAEKILGYPPEEWYTQDFWPNHIHEEDRKKTLDYCVECYQSKENYEFEYRMIAKNGNIVWFHDLVTVEMKNDAPYILRGYLIDITARKEAHDKIQKINEELEMRVEERTAELKEINFELQKAKVSAESSKTAKELFLASMSHEIRTPLNAIIGFQQLLKGTPLNNEQKEYVESIDFAGRNLLVIINDILDLSKIEAGKFQFEEVEFNVSDIIKSVIELVAQRAKEKNIKIFISNDASIPSTLYGDSARLSQILLNLIGNAIKFTDKGSIKIETNIIEDTNEKILCEFKVIDTGIGISEEKITHIFERFSQEDADTSRKYGGTGLGLTISKHLVELQGGTIKAESEKDKGSTFIFLLRFNKKPLSLDRKIIHQNNNPNSKIASKKLSILLAEDIMLNQRLVTKIMEKYGHDLDIAENGEVALNKAKQNTYDIILMDIQMPIMDGYTSTTFIRKIDDIKKSNVPIIALTAHASHAEAEKCLNIGMNAYIAKPFNQLQLMETINKLTL